MAIDKAIDSGLLDNNLRSIADAIRAKGGTTEQLQFPAEFITAIQNISVGKDATISGTPPLVITNADRAPVVRMIQQGKCEQDGTPTPSSPVDIVCNNGVLKIRNYIDPDNFDSGHYYSPTGVYTASASARLSNNVPVSRGDVVLIRTRSVGSGSLNIRYNQFDENMEWVSQSVFVQAGNTTHTERITIAQDGYFNFSGNYNSTNMVVWDEVVIVKQGDDIYADGTPEEITLRGKNLFNDNAIHTIDEYSEIAGRRGNVIPVPAGTYTLRYTVSTSGAAYYRTVINGTVSSYISVNATGRRITMSTAGEILVYGAANMTIEQMAAKKIQLEEGNTATAYEPYVAPQTASAADLLAVGDVKDEQNIITGDIVRRCGVCLYDGTQDIGDDYISTTGGRDVGAIIVYPLAEETTERVDPQLMLTDIDSDTISATANVDISLDVLYREA